MITSNVLLLKKSIAFYFTGGQVKSDVPNIRRKKKKRKVP